MSTLHTRRLACARRAALNFSVEEPVCAADVLAALAEDTQIGCELVAPSSPILGGAQAVLDGHNGFIWLDNSLPADVRCFHAAHEYAHFFLHPSAAPCAPDDFAQTVSDNDALARVDGYSPRQKQEAEANVCAAELLLPLPLARRLFDENVTASAIAARLGLTLSVTLTQLADALLLPEPAPPKAAGDMAEKPLDDSQRAAAEIETGPLLLGAGPGTGKTKTLVGRCRFLTQTQGAAPSQILALTFSNKAAREMEERLNGAGVGGAWVGTFHAFGLEILRRWGEKIGLPGEVRLLDTLDAATLLENHLARLELKALDNLYNPAQNLKGILGAISRAKDELCSPEEYKKLCDTMGTEADEAARELAARTGKVLKKDSDEVEKKRLAAVKASEVARAYVVYEELKAEGGFLDYADLIFQAVRLLETFPDVLESLQSQYPHVLADEYQDVNRGCARLVRLLAGDDARGLWAVGDHRQSIYRFRGASPANVAAFGRDYPNGQRQELAVNYRSRQAIVEAFGASVGANWDAFRGAGSVSAVTFAVADDDAAQADGLVRTLRESDLPWRDQTILCRTHSQAEALAAELSARKVPVLYLGDVLERPEIKDLLCVLTLAAGDGDSALLRVAAFPEYAASPDDTLVLLTTARETNASLLDTLAAAPHAGHRRLAEHLAALSKPTLTPDALLRLYLFEHSAFLRCLRQTAADDFAHVLQKLAIAELLSLATDFDKRLVAPGSDREVRPVRAFLRHVQRMAALGETLRPVVPEAADGLDAVRVLTVHAAKGLEFPVVFVPNLSAGRFPSRGRPSGIPTPPNLTDEFGADDMAEEECLFFVALSRAREHLIVSRPERAGEKLLPPSPLLAALGEWEKTRWTSETRRDESGAEETGELSGELPTFSASALETYQRCPRQYFYQHERKLPGVFLAAGYPQFHGCVRQVLEWLADERELGRQARENAALTRLDAVWTQSGPTGHLHEAKYRQMAETMLRAAVAEDERRLERLPSSMLTATLETCHVRVRPDAAGRDALTDTLHIARHHTRKPGKDDHTHPRLSLLRRAALETHPELLPCLEMRYLEDGARVAVAAPDTDYKKKLDADRVAKYDLAARGIRLRLFPAAPASEDECGSCPYRLICPA